MDKSSFAGVALALGGIFLGMTLEGGKIAQIMQPTAAIIVFGGTIGAVMLQFPLPVVLVAAKMVMQVFFVKDFNPKERVAEIVGYAHKARKEGIVALDGDLQNIQDPFLKKCVMLAVDGTEPKELQKMMELEMDNQAEHEEHIPKVFEAAGGFAPTVGIIGAVLGLIQVMQHLDNISEVGRGIAVAFVATIYGVGLANLICLPAGGKIKIRIRSEQVMREMMLEGVTSILEGMNPRMIETKLLAFFANQHPSEGEEKAEKAA